MVRLTLLALFLIFSFAGTAQASEEKTAATDTPRPEWLERLSVGAIARLEWAGGIFDGGRSQKLPLTIKPVAEYEFSENLRFVGIARIQADAFTRLTNGVPSQPEVSPPDRRWYASGHLSFELREFYLQWLIDPGVITVGKQQTAWGTADVLKVLDVVNPQTFREFILEDFEESRIPMWSINIEYPIGDAIVELVWVLDQTYDELPQEGWLYEFTSSRLRPPAPPGVREVIRDPERPSRLFADSDVGLRVLAFAYGWDVGAYYLYHYDNQPAYFGEVSIDDGQPVVTVTPRYQRTHLLGLSFANAFGDLTVRGEVAYNFDKFLINTAITDGGSILPVRSDELGHVLGFDWTGVTDTFLSTQIFQTWVTNHPEGVTRDDLETFISFLAQHRLMRETLLLEAVWVTNTNVADGLSRFRVAYDVRDELGLWVGLDWFYGSGDGLFGQFDDNSRVLIGAEWRL